MEEIKTLLEKRNIKRIIYVDNEFGIDVYKNNIKSHLRKNISDKSISWPFPIEAGIDHALHECEKWLDNPDNKDSILQFIKEQNIQREPHDVEKQLDTLLPENTLFCITPTEFEEQYIHHSTFMPTETEQLVILMDKYIKEDDADSGMRLLRSFQNKDYIACGLFSNKFEIDDEIDHWTDCEKANNIYPLSKSRVTKGEDSFCIGLRNVVWLRQISDIKEHIRLLYQKAFSKTQDNLDSLDPASFDYAIIKRSAKEGCWEFDVMKRIMLLLLNQHVEELMTENSEFSTIQKLTQTLKLISSFPKCTDKHNSELLKELYKSEIYADISYTNSTYSQIANGDIFEIEGKKRYMLACQPCNLELRKDGSRKSSEFVYLLPIEDQIKKTNRQPYCSQLQPSSDEESKCVNLASYKSINPLILDLVCYNTDGQAVIDLNKDKEQLDDSHIMQENMLTHYHDIYSTIYSHVKLYKKIDDTLQNTFEGEEKQSLLKMLDKSFEMTSELISANYNSENGVIDFNIKRVARYKEPYSQKVLHDFMGYLSRQAFPHDFSK